MRRLVDVFIGDKLRATYPVILDEPLTPSDTDFVAFIRRRMPETYTPEEISAAKFVVRDPLE
jgi:hypothetical protein